MVARGPLTGPWRDWSFNKFLSDCQQPLANRSRNANLSVGVTLRSLGLVDVAFGGCTSQRSRHMNPKLRLINSEPEHMQHKRKKQALTVIYKCLFLHTCLRLQIKLYFIFSILFLILNLLVLLHSTL